MSDAYQLARIDNDAQWDELARADVGGTIFASSAWLHCAEEAFSSPVLRLGCLHHSRLTSGVAGVEQRRVGLRRLVTPPLTPHGGFHCLCSPTAKPAKTESEQHRAAGLLSTHLGAHYGHAHLVHAPSLRDMRPFAWDGWDVTVRYTYQLPIDAEEHMWERLERRTRTVIRKAESAGWESHDTADVDLLGGLYERIYVRQQIRPPVATDAVVGMVGRVLAADLGRAVAVRNPRGDTAAIVVFVRDRDTLYAWVAGADPEHNASGAVSLLYWRVLQQSDATTFDFLGANMPAIARFKRGFGGVVVPYYVTERYRSRLIRTAIPLWRGLRSRQQ